MYLIIELLAIDIHMIALDQSVSQSIELCLLWEETALESVSLAIEHSRKQRGVQVEEI